MSITNRYRNFQRGQLWPFFIPLLETFLCSPGTSYQKSGTAILSGIFSSDRRAMLLSDYCPRLGCRGDFVKFWRFFARKKWRFFGMAPKRAHFGAIFSTGIDRACEFTPWCKKDQKVNSELARNPENKKIAHLALFGSTGKSNSK